MRIDAKKSAGVRIAARTKNHAGRRSAGNRARRASATPQYFDTVENSVISAMRATFRNPLCLEGGSFAAKNELIPRAIGHALQMTETLMRTLEAARIAHRITGVPASILIALADFHTAWGWMLPNGYDPSTRRSNDYFDRFKSFPSVEDSFVDQAQRLSRDRRFQPVMRAASDPQRYVKAVAACKFWDKQLRRDLAGEIAKFDLHDCDRSIDEIRRRCGFGPAQSAPDKNLETSAA
jgi:flagellum-specific peptidoglycan hydrolase FlgJ